MRLRAHPRHKQRSGQERHGLQYWRLHPQLVAGGVEAVVRERVPSQYSSAPQAGHKCRTLWCVPVPSEKTNCLSVLMSLRVAAAPRAEAAGQVR